MKYCLNFLLTSLVFLSISTVSCSKSGENITSPVINEPVLSKVLVIDTTIAHPFDTINRVFFYYDALKRPLRVESTQTTAAGQVDSKYMFRFEYNGSDTLATRSIEDFTQYAGASISYVSKDTMSYTFSGGRLVYDSSYSVNTSGISSYRVQRTTYESGNIIKIVSRGKSSSGPTIYSDQQTIRQVFTNGDISYQLDSSINLLPVSPVFRSVLENNVTYLSNPNPFAKFCNPVRRLYLLDDIGIFSTHAAPRKLFTRESYTYDSWNGSSTNHNQGTIQYSYTFRPDGYPSALREIATNGKITKGIIIYQ
jgi:hypothetical protein